MDLARRNYCMRKNRTDFSNVETYGKIGEYWDHHDISEIKDIGEEVGFEVAIKSEVTYYALEKEIAEKIESIASKHGVSGDALVNK
jgi:hypothetical protein